MSSVVLCVGVAAFVGERTGKCGVGLLWMKDVLNCVSAKCVLTGGGGLWGEGMLVGLMLGEGEGGMFFLMKCMILTGRVAVFGPE